MFSQVKYKGDLKKIHKPVTDMAESLSMQHNLSTSKLSSSVRHRRPLTLSVTAPSSILSSSVTSSGSDPDPPDL